MVFNFVNVAEVLPGKMCVFDTGIHCLSCILVEVIILSKENDMVHRIKLIVALLDSSEVFLDIGGVFCLFVCFPPSTLSHQVKVIPSVL